MKRIIFFVFAAMLSLNALAQYSTDKFWVGFSVRHLPTYYVEPERRTYAISLDASKPTKRNIDFQKLVDDFCPYGWTYDNENPYLTTTFKVYDFEILKSYEFEEITTVTKHGETKEVRKYYPAIDYLLPIDVEINSPQGYCNYTNNSRNSYDKPLIYHWVGDRGFYDPRDAHEYYLDNKQFILSGLTNAILDTCYKNSQSLINHRYVYGRDRETAAVWLLDSKKSQYYNKYKLAKEQIKSCFGQLSAEEGIEETTQCLKDWIHFIQDCEQAMSVTEKKQKSAKLDLLCGLANIYLALEIFDVAEDYANKVNDLGDKRGVKIIKNINNYKNELAKHHLTSKHFRD